MRILLLFVFSFSFNSFCQEYFLFIGTYTTGKSEGIYVYKFNSSTGEATPLSIAKGVQNPSFLELSPSGNFLYAINAKQPGEVTSFAFDRSSGSLRFLNKQPSGGDNPCYVSVNGTGKWVMAGNYSGGNFSALPVQPDGSLGPPAQVINHTGKSVNPNRQEKPHVHAVVFSPDQRFVYVPDLGTDKVMIYNFKANASLPLSDASQSFVKTKGGSGPRHITFHPERPFVYLVEELSGTVSVYRYKNGRLALLQNTSSHPEGYKGQRSSADIHVSPDGRFLYVSNRGEANSIAIFMIEPSIGRLQLRGFQSTLGIQPRNFVIDPSGKYLLVANQESSNIVVFKRDVKTGLLQPVGKQIEIPNPVCLKLLK